MKLRFCLDSTFSSLRFHFVYTLFHFDVASWILVQPQFNFTLISLRFPFDLASVKLTSMSLWAHWLHFDFTSSPRTIHSDFSSVALQAVHFDFASNSLWLHLGFTSMSLRCHVYSISLRASASLRIHIGVTSISFRSNCVVAFQFHVGFLWILL